VRTNPQLLHARGVRARPALGGPATVVLALVLFAVVFMLRNGDPNVGDSEGTLYVVPIALLALRFGLRGGAAGAVVGVALTAAWDLQSNPVSVTAYGYLSRGVAFLVLGVLLGAVVDGWRRLQSEISRYYDASPDLLATADMAGRFTRVNAAWERTLGHSAETLCSHPFIDFVHPEDRDATIAETAVLADGSNDTVAFRNRYRTADGDYRWLQWNTFASPSEGLIYAVAHDISVQYEAEQQLAKNATWLETKVSERTRELDRARAETVRLLALAAEYRDDDTSEHTERVGLAAAEIATRLGLSKQQIKLLREAAPLHDVGKLAIPDRILLKPGLLSVRERETMKTHAAVGACLLSNSRSRVLKMGAVIAGSHHERWDGTGYPHGLAGEAIPLVGRVVAVADVFDALTHQRPYKPAWPVERAIAYIRREAGAHFDPRVVAAFLAIHKETGATTSAPVRRRPARAVTARRRTRVSLPS
jgi:PAS domain S-box-containing protein